MTVNISDPRMINEDDFPSSGSAKDQLYFLLNYAVLAPSNRNVQPWLFRLNDYSVDIVFDQTRALSIVDPNNRELVISCGAAIGNLERAAKYFGYQATVQLASKEQSLDLLASISLRKSSMPSSDDVAIFKAIKQRRTNRSPFSNGEIPLDALNECVRAAVIYDVEFAHFSNKEHKSSIAELVALADRLQFSQPWFRTELASWMHSKHRSSKDGISARRYGIPDILTPIAGFIIQTFNIGKRVAYRNKQKIELGSPVLGILASQGDSQADWLNSGRALARILLTLTCHGLSAAYLNQAIETPSLRRRLRKRSTTLPYPQIMLRIGRADQPPPSVRRCVDDCLIK